MGRSCPGSQERKRGCSESGEKLPGTNPSTEPGCGCHPGDAAPLADPSTEPGRGCHPAEAQACPKVPCRSRAGARLFVFIFELIIDARPQRRWHWCWEVSLFFLIFVFEVLVDAGCSETSEKIPLANPSAEPVRGCHPGEAQARSRVPSHSLAGACAQAAHVEVGAAPRLPWRGSPQGFTWLAVGYVQKSSWRSVRTFIIIAFDVETYCL